jgi:Kdo2-lipid IVA lauroyltransferase/acyltransferase
MAKYYFLPREWAKRHPGFSRFGWRIEAWLIGAALKLFSVLPLSVATALARLAFRSVGPLTSIRKRVEENLDVAFPESAAAERRRWMREIFGNVGIAVAELAQLQQIWRDRAARLEFVAAPQAQFIRRPGTAAVLVTAHVGPWTLTNFIAGEFGFPLTIVYAPESNPFVHDMMLALRSALPVKLISRDNSMRRLMGELAHGATIGLASDVRLDGGEMIPFFGHDMPTNTVPARLALRYGCELVPVRAERLPGQRFRVTVCAPVQPRNPSADAAAQARDMTTQLNALFEDWIRATPGEWMCLARRWPKRPQDMAPNSDPS